MTNPETPGGRVALSPIGTGKSLKLNFSGKTPGKKMDRFVTTRSAMDIEAAHLSLTSGNENDNKQGDPSNSEKEYQKRLAASLGVDTSSRILAFKQKAPAPEDSHDGGRLKGLYSDNIGQAPNKKQFRHVPQSQERILDAPDLVDDYYLNLLDWNAQNIIAVALGRTIYLWNAGTGSVEELCRSPNEGDYICSVAWSTDGAHLALGTSDSKVQIWDASRAKQVRELVGHSNRVSSVAWNSSILSSGGRDGVICNWDVRKRRDEACVARIEAHDQEVCGLKWSHCGGQLASGGNDNILCIHDSSFQLQHKINAHQAAVKAIAWCPFQSNLLGTGGGTADRCIKFWNTHTGANLSSIDTGSQVCALQWSRHERELLSSHGYSKNQLSLWKYPSLVKVAEMTGHQGRVLHMATSPDGSSVVSAGADETLRFWRCFGDPPAASKDAPKLAVGGQVASSQVSLGGLRSIR
ncbi:hypothetical protein CEUSTIGMA_g8295.t1 [Chlamydomonas eustigma]|uniref:CDC20/Fizzy WD40 domain-containing protein n=1 Tax=Chlamydomonas eustigma TaxID=1157962 RepID=A0A250XDM5_9CHLO|nr:hypothetical protein CEUSTIGMA_g8295.t1 [Chlamydomonas eustigma]|eukprot:GAX80860.1 hypothetical protein CEUSTIGMA_g8295.t1 [Chlamydomonas eustigma]